MEMTVPNVFLANTTKVTMFLAHPFWFKGRFIMVLSLLIFGRRRKMPRRGWRVGPKFAHFDPGGRSSSCHQCRNAAEKGVLLFLWTTEGFSGDTKGFFWTQKAFFGIQKEKC